MAKDQSLMGKTQKLLAVRAGHQGRRRDTTVSFRHPSEEGSGSGDDSGEGNVTLELGCWVSHLNFAHLLAVGLRAT